MKKLPYTFLAASLLAASTAAAAEPAAPAGAEPKGAETEFGDQGTIAIGAATGLNVGYTQITPPTGSSRNTIDLAIQPDVQYFIINSLSVGGVVNFDWRKPNDGDAITTFGVGPTVGYNLWVTPGLLSVWPQATFTFNTTTFPGASTTTGGMTTTAASTTVTTTNVGVFVPLLIHPVKHFHFGVGPYFNIDLSSSASTGGTSGDSDKAMNVGIKAEIAGWL